MSRFLVPALTLIFLVACSEESKPEPERPRRDRRSKKSKPIQDPEPEPNYEPKPEPEPRAAPTPAPAHEWWCLCYQRQGATGPEPATACRALESQCKKLEGRVAKGTKDNKDIIAGSLTHACQALRGSHPSDMAGSVEQWKASKLPGAWTSEGICQLDAAVDTGTPAVEADTDTGTPEPLPDSELDAFTANERIGKLGLGMGTAAVRREFGEPERSGAVEEMGATGLFEQDWTYPEGMVLTMSATTRHGPQTISAISITAPNKLRSARGITIGDLRARVEQAYGDVRAPEDEAPASPDTFVAGSIYGGMIFDFKAGAVTQIFLGAAAE